MLVRTASLGLSRSIQAKRIGQAEMARMRRVPERIDDPEIEPGQRLDAVVGHAVEVRRIGHIADPEAERRHIAVLMHERYRGNRAALALDRHRLRRR